MNPDHPHYREWDSAYVLGALAPAERREFEQHLASCEECRRSVAELAPMPGLLARLSGERATTLLDDITDVAAGPRPDLVDDLLRARRSRGIRRVWIWVSAAAAAVILLLTIVVLTPGRLAMDAQTVALDSLTDAPITATVTLTPVDWGTRIDLDCRYEADPADAGEEGRPYVLYVVAEDGSRSEVSSWQAYPGETARLEAGTAVELDNITAIEIGSIGSGTTLMRGSPSG